MDSDKFWSWAWAVLPDVANLRTLHLSNDVVAQDVAIQIIIGYGTEPNRQLSGDEKEYVAALLRQAADNILRGEITFQEGE